MKISGTAVAAVCACGLAAAAFSQTDMGTAITYQGRLMDAGLPASGTYDLRFMLYDSSSGGTQIGPTVALEDVVLEGGLFTVPLDFGAGAFAGQARWLDIAVRPGSDTGAYTPLDTRQALKPGPSALYSMAAGSVAWSALTGVPAGFADGVDDAVPPGTVAFFNLASCPAGWSALVAAEGRYLVGLQSGGTLGATVGTALTDQQNRATGRHNHSASSPEHTHTVDHLHLYWPVYPIVMYDAATGGSAEVLSGLQYIMPRETESANPTTSGTAVNVNVDNAGTGSGTPAPYLQLLVCQKN